MWRSPAVVVGSVWAPAMPQGERVRANQPQYAVARDRVAERCGHHGGPEVSSRLNTFRANRMASLPGKSPRAGGPSSQPSSITAAALRVCEPGQGVDRGTTIGVRIQPDSPRRADTAPVANEERAAEQVWPNGEAVIPPLIPFGADADE